MENSKLSEEKSWLAWNRRTLPERYLILVCLVLFVALLVLIGLLIHLQNIPKKSGKEICLSQICKHQAGSILTNMDFSVDPCQNFHEFACGSFMKYKDIYSDDILRPMDIYNYVIYLAKVQLEKPEVINDQLFQNKIRKYYQSCLNKPTDIKEAVREFLNVTHLDGWPLTEDYHSRSTMEDALALFYDNLWLLFSIYSPQTEADDLKSINIDVGDVILYKNALLNTTEEKYIKAKKQYLDMIEYVFTKLSLPPNDSKRYAEEMVNFETSLAQIQNQKVIDDNSTTSTVAKLESECPQIKWKNTLKLYFEHVGYPEEYYDDYPVDIFSMDYINDLCNLVGNSNKRIIYNLLVWNLLFPYLARFDFTFRQLLSEMTHIYRRTGIVKILSGMDKLKWKSCIMDMETSVRIGLDCIMLNSMTPEKEVKELETFTEEISKTLEEIFLNEDWFDDYAKNITKIKLQNIDYLLGYSNDSLDVDCLNQIFENIIITENYIENILSVKKQNYIDSLFSENTSLCFSKENLLFQPFELNAYYVGGSFSGRLVMSLGIMHPPIYAYGLPKYSNYGGLAFLIAHEFSHGFHQLEDMERSAKVQNSTEKMQIQNSTEEIEESENEINWPKGFIEEYKQRKDCLVNQYFQFPLEGNVTIDGNKTILDNFADNSGLTVAFRAYENYLKNHGEEPTLPGLDFTNKQMFFISYAQPFCEIVQFMKKTYENDGHSPGKYRILVPLMNSPEFSKVFNCPLNSYMNPEHKCKIWG